MVLTNVEYKTIPFAPRYKVGRNGVVVNINSKSKVKPSARGHSYYVRLTVDTDDGNIRVKIFRLDKLVLDVFDGSNLLDDVHTDVFHLNKDNLDCSYDNLKITNKGDTTRYYVTKRKLDDNSKKWVVMYSESGYPIKAFPTVPVAMSWLKEKGFTMSKTTSAQINYHMQRAKFNKKKPYMDHLWERRKLSAIERNNTDFIYVGKNGVLAH